METNSNLLSRIKEFRQNLEQQTGERERYLSREQENEKRFGNCADIVKTYQTIADVYRSFSNDFEKCFPESKVNEK